MQLLGEEINSEIAVLARLRRRRDADDLAWTTLQNQEIANADMVAWDGDGIGDATALDVATGGLTTGSRHGNLAIFHDNVFFAISAVMSASVDRVEDAVGCAVKTVTKGVVMAVLVVVSHVKLVLGFVDSSADLFVDPNFLSWCGVTLPLNKFTRVGRLVLPTRRGKLFSEWGGACAELSFSYVDRAFCVELYVGVALVGLAVSCRTKPCQ